MERIALDELTVVAEGITRPEDILVLPDGRVFASDASAAVSEILPDGSRRQIGNAGGEPNGLGVLPDGRVVMANFSSGSVQRLELDTGAVDVIAEQVDGQPITGANYPLVDPSGSVWVSCSSRQDAAIAMASGARDGYIFRLDPDGTTQMICDELPFPNCMTFDARREYVYVVLSTPSIVVRLRVLGDGALGKPEPYGPPLGGRGDDEYGPELLSAFAEPRVLAVGTRRRLWLRRRGEPLGHADGGEPCRGDHAGSRRLHRGRGSRWCRAAGTEQRRVGRVRQPRPLYRLALRYARGEDAKPGPGHDGRRARVSGATARCLRLVPWSATRPRRVSPSARTRAR